ncbi:MAG: hypothetical protein IJ860_01705 [Eubacterium sp.]|nr:hypothetical protein [Eubacterium sp.]
MIRNRRNTGIAILAAVAAFIVSLWLGAAGVRAASGRVYACTIHPCYRHPVSGVIEDAGGEAAYATGQGMVEGCVSTEGMLEVTDSGKYYLTMRLSLVDYTTDHTFQVQQWGDTEWTDPPIGITGEGTDNNGKTWDITMEVPSDQCVVRGTMMVTPMGRSVVYYFYPDNYAESGTEGAGSMKATMVTAPSREEQTGADRQNDAGQQTGADRQNDAGQQTAGQTPAEQRQSTSQDGTGESAEQSRSTPQDGTDESAEQSQSTVQDGTDGGVDRQAGLSLSTEKSNTDTSDSGRSENNGMDQSSGSEEGSADAAQPNVQARSVGEQILINVVSGVLIGGILMLAGAGILYVFRKKTGSGAGKDPDDYDDLYNE